MFIRRHDISSDSEHRAGDTTKRIIVFLFGALFGVLSGAACFEKAFGFAALFGIPALILILIAMRGGRKSVIAAHEAASVVRDVSHLP